MPIYCKVTRGNHVESQHSVYAVAVNEVGEIIFSTGDPDYQICISQRGRDSCKNG